MLGPDLGMYLPAYPQAQDFTSLLQKTLIKYLTLNMYWSTLPNQKGIWTFFNSNVVNWLQRRYTLQRGSAGAVPAGEQLWQQAPASRSPAAQRMDHGLMPGEPLGRMLLALDILVGVYLATAYTKCLKTLRFWAICKVALRQSTKVVSFMAEKYTRQ